MYEIRVSSKEISQITEEEDIVIFIRENVREGEPTELIGFLTEDGQLLYDALTGVNGIGPRNALKMMDFVDLNTLAMAIETKDTHLLSTLPGIGPKMADRMVVELSGKIKPSERSNSKFGEAVETLIALGFARQEAFEAVRRATESGAENFEDVVKAALSSIRKG
jgi:Holliday junction DNA helicase RuvA